MSPYRTRLLLAFMVFAGVVMVCVRIFDEPEPDRNPFLCPDCGKLLPEKDGVCASCQGKKAREKMDAASRNPGKPAAPEKYSSKNREKAIYAIIAFFVLMAVALWPQIHRFIRSRQHGPEIAYRIFRCQRCGASSATGP